MLSLYRHKTYGKMFFLTEKTPVRYKQVNDRPTSSKILIV